MGEELVLENRRMDCGNAVFCNGQELSRLSVSSGTYHEYLHRKKPRGRRLACGVILLLAVLLLLLLIFVIVAFVTKGFGMWEDTGCHTKQCVQAASRILEYLDPKADPCHDFYQFACGNYAKVHVIPPGKSQRSTFSDLAMKQDIKLHKLLETLNDKDPDYIKQAKNFYKSCMNETLIDDLGIKPLQEYIKRLGGWSVVDKNYDLSKFSFEDYWVHTGNNSFYRLFNSDVFRMSARVDPDNHNKYIIGLMQARLGMGWATRDNYLKGREDKLVKAWEKLINDIAVLLGADANYAKVEVAKIVTFEIELAKLTAKPENLRESANNSRIVTLGEMSNLYKGIDWKKAVTNAFKTVNIDVNDSSRVKLTGVTFFEKVGELIKKTPAKTLAGYAMWRNIANSLTHLDKKTREILQKFRAVKTGVRKEQPRFKSCVRSTNQLFSLTTAKMFSDVHFKGDTDGMVDLTERVKQAFKGRLENADWLDKESRAKANEKIDGMIAKIAFPDYLKNEVVLKEKIAEFGYGTVNPDTYYFNLLDLQRKDGQFYLKKLTQTVDRYAWQIPPILVNAFYSPTTNAMIYPLGILYPPFYDNGGPRSLNFGAIGEVIGHEITHGFDDSGRLYDKFGNKHEWMTKESVARFNELAKCVIESYSNITITQIGEKVNGKLTQGENIADIGGVAQAFHAYQSWVKVNGKEKRLPGVDLSPDQLFFIGYTQQSCSLVNDQYLKRQIRGDPHTPARERVLGALYHTKEFSEVFNCKVGSKMNPKHKCQIW